MRVTWLLGGAIIVACGWWALMSRPLTDTADSPISLKSPTDENAAQTAPLEQIDPNVFAVKLWNPPPPPPTPETLASKPEPTKPLKLQLIGIISEVGAHKAAVYDPDTDRLLIVASGDKVAEHTITEITAKTIELSDGRSTRTLRLTEDQS
jgi:hypothetical protein